MAVYSGRDRMGSLNFHGAHLATSPISLSIENFLRIKFQEWQFLRARLWQDRLCAHELEEIVAHSRIAPNTGY